jgi:lysophospholipase L1-like esterase
MPNIVETVPTPGTFLWARTHDPTRKVHPVMPSPALVRFALTAWYAFQLLERANEPKPRDSPEIRSGDPSADRVLLLGNGPCHGWGVLTHQLGLPGQLSRAIRSRTGRACDVDYVGAESMNVRSARAWLGDRDLESYDAVVIVVGVNDAIRHTPVATWRSALTELIASITPRLRPDAKLHLVGMPPIRSIAGYDNLVGRFAEPQRRRLQNETTAIIRELGLPELIELGPSGVTPEDGAPVYAVHAATLADALAPELVLRAASTRRPALPEAPAWEWSGAGAVLAHQETGGTPALRRLAERAQKRFKVEFAVVSLVNDDRIWHAMNTEVFPPSVPLDLSFCKYTSRRRRRSSWATPPSTRVSPTIRSSSCRSSTSTRVCRSRTRPATSSARSACRVRARSRRRASRWMNSARWPSKPRANCAGTRSPSRTDPSLPLRSRRPFGL